jgi:phosphate transport system permease protein
MRMVSPKVTQRIAWSLTWASAGVVVLALGVIVGYVVIKGAGAIDWEFLSTSPKGGLSGEGGVLSAIVGTVYIVVLTVAIAAPLGIGAGIYLVEYARENWFTRLVRSGVEVLAGVPSIIFGLFGFALFVVALKLRFSILSGALALACLVLPTIIRTTEEALRAVSQSYREASMACGATRFQTIRKIVLPAAFPGILTAIILAVGRSVEETAVLYVTMGGSAAMPRSFLSGGRTLALHTYFLAMETRAMGKALGTALLLIVLIMLINGLIRFVSRRYMARMYGRR